MFRRPVPIVVLCGHLAAMTAAMTPALPAQAALLPLTQHVNPFIGTDDSNAPNPVPGGAGGSTVPGPVAPFGMIQWSPDTPTASPSGYRFSDTQIQEFSLTHFNGAGCANNEDIGILPIIGNIGASPGPNWTSCQATHTKSAEVAQAGYYKAVLSTYGNTQVELTTTKRTGIMRLTYPNTTTAKVLVNTSRSATGNRSGSITVNGATISGSFTGGGFCGSSKTYQVHYHAQFDGPPTSFGTWLGSTVNAGSANTSGVNSGGYLNFDTSTNRVVHMKVGISFVSVANAQANLNAEQQAWMPPGHAPALGTNLALNKPATGSASCNATEPPAKAFDGVLSVASKWCSNAAGTKTLQVDLGSLQNVSSFVVKHAGLGGETTGWNTGAFNILSSADGATWTTRVTVSGNRSSRTYHPIAAVSARYVRLDVTTPANNGNGAARIDEFEVYGGTGGPVNVALNKPATADSSCNPDEGPAKAVNGSVTAGTTDKWCSLGATKFWQADLGGTVNVKSFTVRHAGAGGEMTTWNTRDFTLQVSGDGTNWTTVVTVAGNTANVTEHAITPVNARYVRLNITAPTSTTNNAARIYEVEVYA
ncbi:discoidin domain-containing protein [Allorhizocola rhizosphaerae]|uniref:discoidin domain-containing protein n=1 Tax=Allorhizocola rhizosphaerae TaxID=1872709 RepID=UPI000E3EA30E|nr:discoidin domain-containing protein [Allorhizocola rhizosphaerae]